MRISRTSRTNGRRWCCVLEQPPGLPYVNHIKKMLDIVALGDRVAVLLPEELRARLGVTAGERVDAHVLASGIEADASGFDIQTRVLGDVMARRRDALAILAR